LLINQDKLLNWYLLNKRDLPWRKTNDFYSIWVSEVMLQQTQVVTVIPYYLRWMSELPTLMNLAKTDEQHLLSLWQGLGYYRRCKYLQKGAQWVLENGVPESAKKWQMVPGVGPYTAGAISSIAFSQPEPLVDGNVERVYARLNNDANVGGELKKSAWQWSERNLHSENPGDWNQALMELGATICTPKNPQCSVCPLYRDCLSYQYETSHLLPTPKPKPITKKIDYIVNIHRSKNKFGIVQVPKGQWWEGMWEFPRQVVNSNWQVAESEQQRYLGTIKHTVTHHKLSFNVFLVEENSQAPDLLWYGIEELNEIPMPSPQRKIIKLLEASKVNSGAHSG
jgi:A/G-specific adenine glycosylase